MNCPVCKDAKLVITERQGIEIDYCPDCRGVWLDRGELDKLIERSAGGGQQSSHRPEKDHYKEKDYDKYGYEYKKKKRGGFLDDFFDF